jgi:phage-related protein
MYHLPMLAIVLYRTDAGNSPVEEYVNGLAVDARADLLLAIKNFAEEFPTVVTVSTKHLDEKIWEIRVRDGGGVEHRVLYAVVGSTLLLLNAFTKKTQKTPPDRIRESKKRLKRWLQQ